MPTWSTFALFAVASLALLVVPGPSVFYIVTRSLSQGRAAGMASVLGVASGSVVHIAGAAVGVSVVLARSATAFNAVKLLGATYLVVLGARKLMAGPAGMVAADVSTGHSLRRLYGEGVVVNVLNPKTALFFLALFPQFVDPAQGPVPLQVAVLGALFVVLSVCSDGTYALAASAVGTRLSRGERAQRLLHRVSGLAYVTLGVLAAFGHRPAVSAPKG